MMSLENIESQFKGQPRCNGKSNQGAADRPAEDSPRKSSFFF